MFKLILLVLLLSFACAAAMTLIHRLNRIASELGHLRREVDKKNDELNHRVATFNAQSKAQRQAEQDEDKRTRMKN